MYVDGNVRITKDIIQAAGATSPDKIPYLAIIARGNIYIDPDVSRVDALLIAQPRDLTAANPTDGRVYTCAPSGAPPTKDNIYTLCIGKALAINGAVIAQQLRLGRTYKSLKDGTPLEQPAWSTGLGTNAAEAINYTPQMYVASSPLQDPTTTTTTTGIYGKYDAIFSLPPVY
jgi:hypothetical protein